MTHRLFRVVIATGLMGGCTGQPEGANGGKGGNEDRISQDNAPCDPPWDVYPADRSSGVPLGTVVRFSHTFEREAFGHLYRAEAAIGDTVDAEYETVPVGLPGNGAYQVTTIRPRGGLAPYSNYKLLWSTECGPTFDATFRTGNVASGDTGDTGE